MSRQSVMTDTTTDRAADQLADQSADRTAHQKADQKADRTAGQMTDDLETIKIVCLLDGQASLADGEDEAGLRMSKSCTDYLAFLMTTFQMDVATIIGGNIPKEGRDRQISLTGDADAKVYPTEDGARLHLEGTLRVNFAAAAILGKLRRASVDAFTGVDVIIHQLVSKLGMADRPIHRGVIRILDRFNHKIIDDRAMAFSPPRPRSLSHEELMLAAFARNNP